MFDFCLLRIYYTNRGVYVCKPLSFEAWEIASLLQKPMAEANRLESKLTGYYLNMGFYLVFFVVVVILGMNLSHVKINLWNACAFSMPEMSLVVLGLTMLLFHCLWFFFGMYFPMVHIHFNFSDILSFFENLIFSNNDMFL